jgi:hypothetical protein
VFEITECIIGDEVCVPSPMTPNTTLRWKILPDEEVTSVKADAFGIHTAYAKLLQKIATNCPTPFAIGLYSTWGSGKTSIIRLLQEIVSGDSQSSLIIVYLDVWKYSSDPLKRWILLETERQLTNHGLLKDYKFQGRNMQSHLEFEESLEDKDRIEIDFKNFRRLAATYCTWHCSLWSCLALYPSNREGS